MDITLTNVSFTYMKNTPLERKALEAINLHIPGKKITAIIGHTGSGKSTLIQLIGGLILPDSGKIKVGTYEWKSKKKNKGLQALRKQIGIVFQYPEHQLFEETVEKDIAFGPKNFDFPSHQIPMLVKEAMELVGLDYEEYAARSPFELSGGQMRRVAIAGVLAFKPKILILDEPTAGLDPMGKKEIMGLITRLHHNHDMTTILVSHSMDQVAAIADHLIVLNQGKVLMKGRPEDIFIQGESLREIGLDIPEITKLILMINQKINGSIPLNTFSVDQLEQYLLQRLQKGKEKSEFI